MHVTSRLVLLAAVVSALACAERNPVHPLTELLHYCEGTWEVDSASARRFPDFVAGRERIEIVVTEREPTPSDGGWRRGVTYGHGLLGIGLGTGDEKCPVALVTTSSGLFHPYIRYEATCGRPDAPGMDRDGFAIHMSAVGGTQGTDRDSDWMYVDYRESKGDGAIYPDEELVKYVRANR